ncbi:hypothetical protein [Streptomyces venetus]|uniref:hypothetical protein n=1 Tax=Streptomyces venetus TaxID=1701086 RepID=UPI0031EBC4FC
MSPDRPGADVGAVGAEAAGVPGVEPPSEGLADADRVLLAAPDGLTEATPDGSPWPGSEDRATSGAFGGDARPGAVGVTTGDSPAVGPVRLVSPPLGPVEAGGDSERENPAISAATDTAPRAPTTTPTR